MQLPSHLRYTDDHEWVAIDGNRARIGITDYAQSELGSVVYVQLPKVGSTVSAGDAFGEIESSKSVSDVYAPVAGTVVAVNDARSEEHTSETPVTSLSRMPSSA